jgi:hypothetical protein
LKSWFNAEQGMLVKSKEQPRNKEMIRNDPSILNKIRNWSTDVYAKATKILTIGFPT